MYNTNIIGSDYMVTDSFHNKIFTFSQGIVRKYLTNTWRMTIILFGTTRSWQVSLRRGASIAVWLDNSTPAV